MRGFGRQSLYDRHAMLDWADTAALLALLVGVWQLYLARRASAPSRTPVVLVARVERSQTKPFPCE